MRGLVLFSLLFFVHGLNAQNKTIKLRGHVSDAQATKSLSLVLVKTEGNVAIAIANSAGDFMLNLPIGLHSLKFSHIGYETIIKKVTVKKTNGVLNVSLRPIPFLLEEVIVRGERHMNAREMISKLAANLQHTLRVGSYQAKGFQREYRKKNGKYVFFAEAITDHFNGGYSEHGHSYNQTKALEYRISDQDTSISSIKNILFPRYSNNQYNPNILLPILLEEYFLFECVDTLRRNGRQFAVLNYQLNPEKEKRNVNDRFSRNLYAEHHHYGEIMIDLKDWSLDQITNKGNDWDDNRAEYIITGKFKEFNGEKFLSQVNYISVYKERNVGASDSCEVERCNETKFANFDTCYLTNDEVSKRYNCSVRMDKRFGTQSRFCSILVNPEDKMSKYNLDFWETMPYVEDWAKVKVDLKKMSNCPIEDQFKRNSNFMVSESKYKTIQRSTDKKIRKRMQNWYRDYKKQNIFN